MRALSTIRKSLASLVCCAIPLSLHAQEPAPANTAAMPTTLTLVVGYAPGGAADTTARAYAEQLRKDGVGTVIVENRPGASGRVGLTHVRDSKPDGATLYLVPSPLLTIFPLTYKDAGYDAKTDLRAVATLVDIPTAIVAGASQPYNTMKDYVKWAKQQPERPASLGVATLGSSGHLGILAVNASHDMKIEPVAYRGASPMLVDVASGEVAIGWDAVASMVPLQQAGKVKFLGISGTQRLDTMPDVTTLSEQGFPAFEAATSFYGIVVPAATPTATVNALESAFLKASESPALRKQLSDRGLLMAPATGAEMEQRTHKELEFWRPIVEKSGIKMD